MKRITVTLVLLALWVIPNTGAYAWFLEEGGPSFSPDGETIIFHSNRGGVYTMTIDCQDKTPLVGYTDVDVGSPRNPVYSPNGEKIAFATEYESWDNRCDIYICDKNGSNVTRLTTFYSDDDKSSSPPAHTPSKKPSFSPDGTKTLFTHTEDDNSRSWVYIVNIDGTDLTCLSDEDAYDISPAFSPDGENIVYTSYASTIPPPYEPENFTHSDSDIYIMNADGSGKTRLTDGELNYNYASFSPDGEKIIYVSGRYEQQMIYIMDLATREVTTILDELSDIGPAIFAHTGDNIAYYIWSIGFVIENLITGEKVVSNHYFTDYSFSPDGSKIAVRCQITDAEFAIGVINTDGTGFVKSDYDYPDIEYSDELVECVPGEDFSCTCGEVYEYSPDEVHECMPEEGLDCIPEEAPPEETVEYSPEEVIEYSLEEDVAEESEIGSYFEGTTYKWDEIDPIFDFENEWRPDFDGKLYAEPQTDSDLTYYEWDPNEQENERYRIHATVPEVVFEGSLEDVEVLAGISLYHIGQIYGLNYAKYSMAFCEGYVPWFKIKSGDVSGWAMNPPIFDGSVVSDDRHPLRPYIIGFIDDYSPLLDKSSGDSKPLSYKLGGVLEFDFLGWAHLGPDVSKGTIAFTIGRKADWLCIGIGPVNRGWMPYDESVISVLRLVYEQPLPVEMFAQLGVYLPIDDPISCVGFVVHQYYDDGIRFLADPKIKFTTKNDEVSTPVILTGHDGGDSTCDGYSFYFAELPEEVSREDLSKITFYPGNEPDEEYCNEHYVIEIDPKEIW